MRRTLLTLLAMLSLAPSSAQAQATKPVSIVLVHGAFVDASGWKQVHDGLVEDGYEVLVVQNPTITLKGDVEATARAIKAARYPVVLVGHSYGGAVITEAGDDPKVRDLVYIAAFAPDLGETVYQLATKPTPGEPSAPLLPPSDGFLIVDPAKFPAAFADGADASLTRFMAASQVPWGLEAVQGPITRVAWKTKPTTYMVASEDHMIPPSAQRSMAKRTGGKITEIRAPHAAMLTHPKQVIAFIEAAATAKP